MFDNGPFVANPYHTPVRDDGGGSFFRMHTYYKVPEIPVGLDDDLCVQDSVAGFRWPAAGTRPPATESHGRTR